MFVRDMESVTAAFGTAQAAQQALQIAMRDLELAIAGDDLDGIDDLDLSTYDVDSIVAWADEEADDE